MRDSSDYKDFPTLQYNKGWHRCQKCLLVRPEKFMQLSPSKLYWWCADEKSCQRMRTGEKTLGGEPLKVSEPEKRELLTWNPCYFPI